MNVGPQPRMPALGTHLCCSHVSRQVFSLGRFERAQKVEPYSPQSSSTLEVAFPPPLRLRRAALFVVDLEPAYR